MTRHVLRRVATRVKDATGSNLVEAAMISPVLVMLTLSVVDFGGLFYAYLALENGVSQATRYGVTGNQMADPANPSAVLSRVDSIKTAMRDATPTLTIPDGAFAFEHRAPGSSSWTSGTGGPNDIEKVSVTYTWSLFTPVLWPFFQNGQITLKVDSAMKNEGRFE